MLNKLLDIFKLMSSSQGGTGGTGEDKHNQEGTGGTGEENDKRKGYLARAWDRFKEWVGLGDTEAFFRGRVSRIHLYEARERYFTLREMVKTYKEYYCSGEGRSVRAKIPEDCRQYVDNVDVEKATKDLETCEETLENIKKYRTRKQGDLNNLWRAMTRVRVMLTDSVIPDTRLSTQLYFCHEEAYRLAVADDPVVKDMLQRLAEAMDEKGQQHGPQFRCLLRALLERFSTIRTGRIHQQYKNMFVYKIALAILLAISVPLITHGEQFLQFAGVNEQHNEQNQQAGSKGEVGKNGQSGPATPPGNDAGKKETVGLWSALLGHVSDFLVNPKDSVYGALRYIINRLKGNILAFVFFGGLLGGFLSVTMREWPRDRVPGEDSYLSLYIMTKPLVGAVGAMCLYILIAGEFVSFDIIKTDELLRDAGPVTFGFAFLSGFSERLVFPGFR